MCAGVTCTLTVVVPRSQGHGRTPLPRAWKDSCWRTRLCPHRHSHSHSHTHTHTYFAPGSQALTPSPAPFPTFWIVLCFLPRAGLERGAVLQVLTRPVQSTCAPHLPGLWPLYGRPPCPGSPPEHPVALPSARTPLGPPRIHLLADTGIWERPRWTGPRTGPHPREQE